MRTSRSRCCPHDKSLDLIALLDFEGVDIGLFEGRSHLWPSRVFEDLQRVGPELAGKLGDRGLEPADVFLQTAPDFDSLAPNHPDPPVAGRPATGSRRRVEFAAECGGRHVTALPGVHFDGVARGGIVRPLLRRAGLALSRRPATQGITFSVEAHVGSIAPTPAAAARTRPRASPA